MTTGNRLELIDTSTGEVFGAIDVLRLQPGDLVVIRSPVPLSVVGRERIRSLVGAEVPGHKVLVLDGGLSLSGVRP